MTISFAIPIWLYWIVYAWVVLLMIPVAQAVVAAFLMSCDWGDRAVAIVVACLMLALTVTGFVFGIRHSY